MKAEDIIEGLNRHIEVVRSEKSIKAKGHIVLHKEIVPHPSFKVYKMYAYTVWFAVGKKLNRLFTIQQTARITESLEEAIIRELNIILSTWIFNWIGSSSYNEVINGEYGKENTGI